MKLTVVIKGSHSRVLRYTSLSAKRDGAADDVKAARRSWSRVAKRVLKSKNPVTRARWLKRLKTVTAYMVRRLQSVPKKKKVSAKLKAQIDYGKKYVALYNRITKALSGPYQIGMEKLAEIKIPKPGTDIEKPGEHVVPDPEVKATKKPEPKEKKLSGQTAAKPAARKPSRVSVLKKRADVLKKDVQEKFKLAVRVSELFDKARDAYAKTKSADSKLKLELVAKRLGEVKKKVAESKKKRDAFTQRFRKSLSEPEVKYA